MRLPCHTTAAVSDEQQRLSRVLQFDSPTLQTVWFRALAGEVTAESDRIFRVGRLRLTVPDVRASGVQVKQRPMSGNLGSSELLLKFELPQGTSTQEILYELLEK